MEKIPSKNEKEVILEGLKERGYLGMRVKDFPTIEYSVYNIDHTIDRDKIAKNPEKTLGELLSDEEILRYIRRRQKWIKENEQQYPPDDGYWATPYNERPRLSGATGEQIRAQVEIITGIAKRELSASIQYLKSIGRLPENFNLDDVVS